MTSARESTAASNKSTSAWTKSTIVSTGLKPEIQSARREMRSEFGGIRAEFREEIGGMRGELGEVRKEINGVQRTMVFGAIALTGAILTGFAGICGLIATQL
jgi:hypothetical protein